MIRHNIFLPILLVLLIICCGPDTPEQPSSDQPVAIERWPEEGIPVIAWMGEEDSMAVYERPGDESPARHIAVAKNQELSWNKSLILVQKLGQLRILEDCVISGFVYDGLENNKLVRGKPRQLNFAVDTILDVVCPAAEGDYIVLYHDQYVEMSGSMDYVQIVAMPQTAWWVRLKEIEGPSLWIRVDGKEVAVIDRKF